jgi:serine/threonine-protein kinase
VALDARETGKLSANVDGELIAGRFELEEQIGSGGMARVYRARDRQLGRRVAIKILDDRYAADPQHLERFRHEARAVARLGHPNIVTVIDRGESDGRQYIVFEYVAGENLKELVRREGPLPVRRALELAIEVARALAYAHAHGVVHRDVKPQNVLLRDGSAQVTDFGIARTEGLGTTMGDGTTAGTILGTGDYISPEQARGQPADERSDVYSLGAMLFELLTGHVPFPADSAVAAATRHVTDPVPDVLAERPDVPVRLANAVEEAMAKDPADRFASMDDMLSALLAARADLPGPEAAATMILPAVKEAPPPRARRRSRRRWPVLVFIVVLIAIAAGIGIYLDQRHGGSSSPPSDHPTSSATVHLQGFGSYDPPPGDGQERNDLVSQATDGSIQTFWQTERYTTAQFGNLKKGVGLVLSTGTSPAKLSKLTVETTTPGFTAEIRAGDTEGSYTVVSSPQTVSDRTTFDLHLDGPKRFYVIWITQLVQFDTGDPTKPFGAKINEVTGST